MNVNGGKVEITVGGHPYSFKYQKANDAEFLRWFKKFESVLKQEYENFTTKYKGQPQEVVMMMLLLKMVMYAKDDNMEAEINEDKEKIEELISRLDVVLNNNQ